jgi:hypothetical protein
MISGLTSWKDKGLDFQNPKLQNSEVEPFRELRYHKLGGWSSCAANLGVLARSLPLVLHSGRSRLALGKSQLSIHGVDLCVHFEGFQLEPEEPFRLPN